MSSRLLKMVRVWCFRFFLVCLFCTLNIARNPSVLLIGLGLSTISLVWGQAPAPTPVPDAATLNTVVRENLAGHYRLTRDINLNETGYFPWLPIGNLSQPFTGILEGNNRLVYGLGVNTTANKFPTGLFSVIRDAHIHHLVLVQPRVESHGYGSPAGTLAGDVQGSSMISHIVIYRGQVQTTANNVIQFLSPAGLLAGLARGSCRIGQILVTGTVTTHGNSAYTGGLLGQACDNALIERVICDAYVTTYGYGSFGGGLLGFSGDNACTIWTLSTGNVTTHGRYAFSGGHTGFLTNDSRVRWSVATGNITTNGQYADIGSHTGYCSGDSVLVQSLATGAVVAYAYGYSIKAGSLVGTVFFKSRIENNMGTGNVTIYASGGNSNTFAGTIVGYRYYPGPVRNNIYVIGQVIAKHVSKNTDGMVKVTRMGLPEALNASEWNAGNDDQYPILTGINPAWQDLRRMSSTQNGQITFPAALLQLAVPGPANESLFDQREWNLGNGYLPLLKGVGQKRAKQAGLDCDPGSFACCPTPLGVPEFLTINPETGHLYVVAYQPHTHRLLLVRYNADTTLDGTFGNCGQYNWFAEGLSSSFQVTSGVYRKSDKQLYLSIIDNNRMILVSLDTSLGNYHRVVSDPGSGSGSGSGAWMDTMNFPNRLYYTGESGQDLLLDEYTSLNPVRTHGGRDIIKVGHALLTQGDYLYLTGRTENDALILLKYDRTDNQIVVRLFNAQGREMGRQILLAPGFSGSVPPHGLAFDPAMSRIWLVGSDSGGALALESLDIQWPTMLTSSAPGTTATQTPDMASTMTPDITATLAPGMASTMTPDITATLAPGMASTMTLDIAATLAPGMASTMTPNITAILAPAITATMIPALTPSRNQPDNTGGGLFGESRIEIGLGLTGMVLTLALIAYRFCKHRVANRIIK